MSHSFSTLSRPLVGVFSSVVDEFRTLGYSSLLVNHPYLYNAVRLLLVGPIIETARRLFQWVVERFRFRYSISANFQEGDPAFAWLSHFMTTENIWRKSRDFNVFAKNSSSKRRWTVGSTALENSDNVDFVPLYDDPQIFRWNGYWLEVRDNATQTSQSLPFPAPRPTASISLTIYTLDMSVLAKLVEEARSRYIEACKPHVTVHTTESANHGQFNITKQKPRRALSTLILDEGVVDSIVQDAVEFLKMEEWYVDVGIPHRRGYLLHGPPGVGKTSTVYAIAGELGLEIYSLSLASSSIDDLYLQRAMAAIPKRSIVLIEDIDCAFLPRDIANTSTTGSFLPMTPISYVSTGPPTPSNPNSRITLSGLLNMLDGVGSEEGKLFFATTNHIDRLDPALLRPGRIDMKIQYHLSTKQQTSALFSRFFPENRFGHLVGKGGKPTLAQLGEKFSTYIPENTFSTAQLQGYLLMWKMQPVEAVAGIEEWVKSELDSAVSGDVGSDVADRVLAVRGRLVGRPVSVGSRSVEVDSDATRSD